MKERFESHSLPRNKIKIKLLQRYIQRSICSDKKKKSKFDWIILPLLQILRIRVLQRTDDCVKQKIHLLLIFLNERFCTFRANKREKCIFSRKCTKYRFWQVYFLLFVMLKKVNYFVEPIIKKILMWCKKDWELKKTSLQIHFT